MSLSRVCRPCRASKLKCDLQRPACGSCVKRGLTCDGYAPESEYLFRDQNDTAKANSIRARRGASQKTEEAVALIASSSTSVPGEPSQGRDIFTAICQRAMPWLSERSLQSIQPPILKSLTDRAMEIFNAEWVLNPYNNGDTPGYLELLPIMTTRAGPSSALLLSVEAFALANIQHFQISQGNLKNMALAKYGAALAAVRRALTVGDVQGNDFMLMAILIIDMFEITFMDRRESLGPHSQVIEHLLTARGTEQVYSVTGFALYRIAHHRLQSRQLDFGLEPLPVQISCLDQLNQSFPAICLGATLLRAQQTLHVNQQLLEASSASPSDKLKIMRDGERRLGSLLNEMDSLLEHLPVRWQPDRIPLVEWEQLSQIISVAGLLPLHQVRVYDDPWMAYQMNFFHHGQLVIRQRTLDMLYAMMELNLDVEALTNLKKELKLHQKISNDSVDAIAESIPPLMNNSVVDGNQQTYVQGKKISQWFACAACLILQHGKYISAEHKDFASKAWSWMHQENSLA